MSAEREGSIEPKQPNLRTLASIVLREMAESTRNYKLLHDIQFVAVERAIDDSYDLIAADLATFIEQKYRFILEEVSESDTALDDDSLFAWLIAEYYEVTSQQVVDTEEAHINLFKHPEE